MRDGQAVRYARVVSASASARGQTAKGVFVRRLAAMSGAGPLTVAQESRVELCEFRECKRVLVARLEVWQGGVHACLIRPEDGYCTLPLSGIVALSAVYAGSERERPQGSAKGRMRMR